MRQRLAVAFHRRSGARPDHHRSTGRTGFHRHQPGSARRRGDARRRRCARSRLRSRKDGLAIRGTRRVSARGRLRHQQRSDRRRGNRRAIRDASAVRRAPMARACVSSTRLRVRYRRRPVRSATRRMRSASCAQRRAPFRRSRSPSCGASATSSTSSSRAVAMEGRDSTTRSCSPRRADAANEDQQAGTGLKPRGLCRLSSCVVPSGIARRRSAPRPRPRRR